MSTQSKAVTINQAALVERLPVAYGYLKSTIGRSFAISVLTTVRGKLVRHNVGEDWQNAVQTAVAHGMYPIDVEAIALPEVFGNAKFRLRARVDGKLVITCSTVGWKDSYRNRNRQLTLPETREFTSLDSALTWMSDAADIYLATASAPIELE